jgi:hypothetical protein
MSPIPVVMLVMDLLIATAVQQELKKRKAIEDAKPAE